MEKRIILAGVLSFAIILMWEAWVAEAPKPEEDDAKSTVTGASETGTDPSEKSGASATPGAGDPSSMSPSDSGSTPQDEGASPSSQLVIGVPQRAGAAKPDPTVDLVLANDVVRVAFDRKGAQVETLWLLSHRAQVDSLGDGFDEKFRLIDTAVTGRGGLVLRDDARSENWLDRVAWDTEGPSADGQSIVFSLPVREAFTSFDVNGNEGRVEASYRLEKRIALTDNPNRFEVTLKLRHLSGNATIAKTFFLSTSGGVFPETIRGVSASRAHSIIGQGQADDREFLRLSASDLLDDDSRAQKSVDNAVFACDMGVYFGAYLHRLDSDRREPARVNAVAGKKGGAAIPEGEDTWSELGANLNATTAEPEAVARFDWYVGPKDHRKIKENYASDDLLRRDYLEVADIELSQQGFCCITEQGPIGWIVKIISKFVVSMLSLFYGLFGNMGIAIVVLTLIVRTVMFPITRKSQVAMQAHAQKMAKLKPKLEKLKEKYKDDRQVFAQKQMELFRKEKVQMLPVGGCLPMFLQIPIFFGLFSAIRFDYDLRHAPFLWCNDLSAPDSVISFDPIAIPCCFDIGPGIQIDGLNIFPLLMIAAMFFHQLGMPKSPDPQMQQQQKIMMFMPLIFGFMMYGYAAGLSVYWLSSSLFGIFEQRVIKKFLPLPTQEEPAKA